MGLLLLLQRSSGALPFNPQQLGPRALAIGLEHRRQLHHQHQLAGLRRRDDHERLDPDARPGGAELHFRRHGHGGPGRPRPGHPPAQGHQPGQLLGGPDPRAPCTSCCPCPCCSRCSCCPRAWSRPWGPAPVARLLAPITGANGKAVLEQVIAVGPVASQEAIKMLGTNGGGFFNANSAHPSRTPLRSPTSLQILAILLIPAGALPRLRRAWCATGARAGPSWRP